MRRPPQRMTVAKLKQLLKKYGKGVLKAGIHTRKQREFCVSEFRNKVIAPAKPLSDDIEYFPDLRDLNDLFTDDKARTAALLPVMAALWDWERWSLSRQRSFVLHIHAFVEATWPAGAARLDVASIDHCLYSFPGKIHQVVRHEQPDIPIPGPPRLQKPNRDRNLTRACAFMIQAAELTAP